MIMKLNKKIYKNLTDKKRAIDLKQTPNIAGGGFTSEWFKELSRQFCHQP